MRLFHRDGRVVYGSAAGLFINGQKITAAPVGPDTASWLDNPASPTDPFVVCNLRVSYPDQPEVWALGRVDTRTGEVVALSLDPADRVRAGGGVTASWPNARPGDGRAGGVRVYTLDGAVKEFPGANILNVGPTGYVAIDNGYDGTGIDVLDAHGQLQFTIVTGSVYASRVRVSHDTVAWIENGQAHAVAIRAQSLIPVAPRRDGVNLVIPVDTAGGRVLVEIDNRGRLTARLASNTVGVVLEERTDQHWPDAVVQSPFVGVGWSTTPGEGPSSARFARFYSDLMGPHVDLDADPLVTPLVVAPFTRPMAVGVWFASYRGKTGSYPGNCLIGFDDYTSLPNHLPAIGANVPDAQRMGVWFGSPVDMAATTRTERAFAYSDGRVYDPAYRSLLHRRDIAMLQAYPQPGELFADFEASLATEQDKVRGWGVSHLLVPAFFDRNGAFTIQGIRAYGPSYDVLARRPGCVGLIGFDFARSGMAYHPELYADFVALTNASPGFPIEVHPATRMLPQTDPTPDPTPDPVPPPPSDPSTPPVDEEEPAVNLQGPELEKYLDARPDELRAFLHHKYPNTDDWRQRAAEAVGELHQACDRVHAPRRTASPAEIRDITDLYLFERDTPGSRTRMTSYCDGQVRLRQ